MNKEQIIELLEKVREKSPLVHNITNYVVMNNTANALLAIGASPVMAHAYEEVEDMVSIASSLVINMGTLSSNWVEAMIKAGKKASELKKPIVFDPVGVGATTYRTTTAEKIILSCKPTIIRGNASEIMALSNSNITTKGVDSIMSGNVALESAKSLAEQTNSVVIISGETDFITDGKKVITLKNGSPLMAKVTGMGCTATAIIGAFASIEENVMKASVSAMAVMGITGEMAAEKSSGTGSMQMNFLDILSQINAQDIEKRLKLKDE